MTEIIIENIIASTNIESEIDLEELHKDLKDSQINYELDENEDKVPLSVLWENEDDIALILFNDGRLVSVQAVTIEDAKKSINNFIELLKELSYIK